MHKATFSLQKKLRASSWQQKENSVYNRNTVPRLHNSIKQLLICRLPLFKIKKIIYIYLIIKLVKHSNQQFFFFNYQSISLHNCDLQKCPTASRGVSNQLLQKLTTTILITVFSTSQQAVFPRAQKHQPELIRYAQSC